MRGSPGAARRAPSATLRLAGFHGLRFDLTRVTDPAGVTSPPYDMVDAEAARRLAAEEAHNVVRLILPAIEQPDLDLRYRRAALTLRDWQADGTLREDARPALYVYEQVTPDARQRGLIGALRLPTADAPGPVLPHEDVADPVVADRTALMRATRANLEPILLSYRGDGAASDVVDAAAAGPALLDVAMHDGTRHRLWAVTDSALLRAVDTDLAGRQALIADGHHRYAAYQRLREAALPGSGYGLAMLVDSRRHPLVVRAIHRVVPRLRLDDAVDALASRAIAKPQDVSADLDTALAALRATPADRFAVLLADGRRAVLVTDLASEPLDAAPPERPEAWRRLDVTVLHYGLLPLLRANGAAARVTDVADAPAGLDVAGLDDVRFDHSAAHAVACAATSGGTAILLRPVAEHTVHELAAAGVRMPRKSTSFGPKPATGVVMRLLDSPIVDEAGEPVADLSR